MISTSEQEVIQIQRRILANILTVGLLSSFDQRQNGIVPFHSRSSNEPMVDGCVVGYKNPFHGLIESIMELAVVPKREQDAVRASLYRNEWSVLPVIAERFREMSDEFDSLPDEEVESRLYHSAVVIACAKDLCLDEYVGDLPLAETGVKFRKSDLSSPKLRAKSPVPPEQFQAVLVPERLVSRLDISNTQYEKIVPVRQRNTKVFWDSRKPRTLHVPDYETPVRVLLRSLKQPLFLHGVRLPIDEDDLNHQRR